MNVLKKLTSRRGETLTETLAALLIVGLASGVLATMVIASSRMNATAMDKDAALYAAVTAAETGPEKTGETHPQVTVTIDSVPVEFDVSYYGDDDGTLSAYRYSKSGEVVAP